MTAPLEAAQQITAHADKRENNLYMHRPFRIPVSYYIAISASGLGIGILVGLSASPVVNGVLAGILALAAGVVGALCGVQREQDKPEETIAETSEDTKKDQGSQLKWNASPFAGRVSPVPMAYMVIAIVVGSLIGLYARTHEWFAETPEHLVEKWQKSTGLSKEAIALLLFNSLYGAQEAKSPESPKDKPNPSHIGSLFDVPEDVCRHLRRVELKNLRLELQGIGKPQIAEFATKCKDNDDLQLALNLLICPEQTR